MTFWTRAKKMSASGLAGLMVATTVAATAEAGPRIQRGYHGGPYHGHYGGYRRDRDWGGPLAAGIIGGLALGAIAGSAARANDCWVERQRVVTPSGRYAVRDVRVCR